MKSKVDSIAKKAFEEESKLMSDLNRGQLEEGKTALGTDMPSYVSNSKAPKAPGAIKLFDTGEYTRKISPLFNSKGVDMTSLDSKVEFLDRKYPIALGLDDESIRILQNKVIPEIQKDLLNV